MNSKEILRHEAAQYRQIADDLRQAYADIDPETLADTAEGFSDLPDMIEEILRSSLEDGALIVALKARLDDMATRLSRFKARYERKRELAAWAMGLAGLAKVQAADFSACLSQGSQRLEVHDEARLPARFFVPQPPKLDRTGLAEALKAGAAIDGAALVYGAPYVSVRTK